jgi:hypothetical protein
MASSWFRRQIIVGPSFCRESPLLSRKRLLATDSLSPWQYLLCDQRSGRHRSSPRHLSYLCRRCLLPVARAVFGDRSPKLNPVNWLRLWYAATHMSLAFLVRLAAPDSARGSGCIPVDIVARGATLGGAGGINARSFAADRRTIAEEERKVGNYFGPGRSAGVEPDLRDGNRIGLAA